jgi:two-component system sensor histidine kinase/response regulator
VSLVKKTNLGFVFALLMTLGSGLLTSRSAQILINSTLQQSQSKGRSQALADELSLLKDAETGQRGYLLTSKDAYLQPYTDAAADVRQGMRTLFDLYAADPSMLAYLRIIDELVGRKMAELDRTLMLAKGGDVAGAVTLVRSDVGKDYMDAMRLQFAAMAQREEQTLQRAAAEVRANVAFSNRSILLANCLGFLTLAWAAYFVNRDRRVRQRSEADLVRANAGAQQAAQAKSEFLATMSHEIRTPLNGITGMSDLLLDTPLNVEQRHFTEVLQRSAMALLHIVNDILDFSKIDAGKLELETIQFAVASLVEGQLDIVSDQAEKKNLALLSFVDPQLATMYRGDPGRIAQILLNLLSNALKFTRQGHVVLRVAPSTLPAGVPGAGQPSVRFSVQDSGDGLDAVTQDKLFKPFSQADSSTARHYGGTGLGLAISRRLAELMGGSLGVQSVKGHGATFFLELPLQPLKAEEMVDPPVKLDPTDLSTLRVLVVDDDPVACDILVRYLRNWGLTAQEAESGAAALVRVEAAQKEQTPFDILFVDKMMPAMDGCMLARAIIRQYAEMPSRAPPPKMVMMSAFDRSQARRAYATDGFAAFLPKPLKQSQLFDCLVSLRQGRSGEEIMVRPVYGQKVVQTGKLILVAEDNAVNQLLVTKLLEKLGYGAHVVANGREAVEALGRIHYDLCLMDCQMPEMDGYEATRQIRSNEQTRHSGHLPIVALTANAVAGDAEKCLASGMDDYLTKPLKKERLEIALRQWLAPRS